MKNRLRKNLTNKEQRDHPPGAAHSFVAVLKTIELVSAVIRNIQKSCGKRNQESSLRILFGNLVGKHRLRQNPPGQFQ